MYIEPSTNQKTITPPTTHPLFQEVQGQYRRVSSWWDGAQHTVSDWTHENLGDGFFPLAEAVLHATPRLVASYFLPFPIFLIATVTEIYIRVTSFHQTNAEMTNIHNSMGFTLLEKAGERALSGISSLSMTDLVLAAIFGMWSLYHFEESGLSKKLPF